MLRMKWLQGLALVAVLALVAGACAPEEEVAEEPEEEPAEEPEEEPAEEPEPVDAEGMVFGYVLPETGDLAFLGPPQIRAAEMAIEEINAAGGVLGEEVTLLSGDESDDTAVAAETAQRLLDEGVHVIIGAAASSRSLAIIDQVVNAGVAQCSGSNTAPTFSDYDDNGLYFRTAPTDALQGPVLAETIIGDGQQQVVMLARADDYGQGLLEAARDELEEAGAQVAEEILYDPLAATFDSEVEQAVAANPDAIAVIAFEEGTQVLQTMVEAGIGPQDLAVYGADGLRSEGLPELVDPGNPNVLDGMKGTAPDPGAVPEFLDRLAEFAPDLDETQFAAQVYDCVVLMALAAEAAESTDPEAFSGEVVNLTTDGTECTGFEECAELMRDGEDIDYQFASGIDEFVDVGEPSSGVYEVWEFVDGELQSIDSVESTLE